MKDQGDNTEILEALQGIQAELKRINQTLAGLAGQSSAAPRAGAAPRSSAPRGTAYKSAPARGGKPGFSKTKGYEAPAGEEGASRYPSKKPAIRGKVSKGPSSFKKGDGYPKRPK